MALWDVPYSFRRSFGTVLELAQLLNLSMTKRVDQSSDHALSNVRRRVGSADLNPPYGGSSGSLIPQLTAFLTSASILASSSAVSCLRAKEVGHMLPSSRFASALKPNVAYLSLNFDAAVK
jgi:hypothetical protein